MNTAVHAYMHHLPLHHYTSNLLLRDPKHTMHTSSTHSVALHSTFLTQHLTCYSQSQGRKNWGKNRNKYPNFCLHRPILRQGRGKKKRKMERKFCPYVYVKMWDIHSLRQGFYACLEIREPQSISGRDYEKFRLKQNTPILGNSVSPKTTHRLAGKNLMFLHNTHSCLMETARMGQNSVMIA